MCHPPEKETGEALRNSGEEKGARGACLIGPARAGPHRESLAGLRSPRAKRNQGRPLSRCTAGLTPRGGVYRTTRRQPKPDPPPD